MRKAWKTWKLIWFLYVANLNFVRKKSYQKSVGLLDEFFTEMKLVSLHLWKHANLDELIDWSTAPIFSSEAGATILSTWKTSARLSKLKVNLTTCSGTLNVIFEEPQTILAFGNHCKENKSDFMIEMVFIFSHALQTQS